MISSSGNSLSLNHIPFKERKNGNKYSLIYSIAHEDKNSIAINNNRQVMPKKAKKREKAKGSLLSRI